MHPNLGLFMEGGELEKISHQIKNPVVESFTDSVVPSRLRLTCMWMMFLHEHELDGSIHHAEVLKRPEQVEYETEHFFVGLGHNKHQ
jgi:hypothetical protein